MTPTEKPLSPSEEVYKLIDKWNHADSVDRKKCAFELYPLRGKVKRLEANRAFLLKTHSEQVDLINELQAKVESLEAERDKLREQLDVWVADDVRNTNRVLVVESALRGAQERIDYWCEQNPLLRDSSLVKELKVILGGSESCTKADAEEEPLK